MAFTAVANWVVGAISTYATVGAAFAAGAYAVAALGAAAAIGAAYVTSRVINGNPNKGNNSARNEGGRIQVAPATNNKIPVIYGNAYVNGMITDARLTTLDQKDNNVMFYCIVLGETTNNINTTYGLESVYWNDLRLTALSSTSTESHVVKDGRKVVNVNNDPPTVAGSFLVDKTYVITKLGTTTQAQWNTIAGTAGRTYGVGSVFQAATTGASSGTGEALVEDFIDENFIVGTNQYVQMRVYAGGSSAADQIFPTNANNKANAYNFWGSTPQNPNGDGSWTSANEMNGLVFAIIKLRYGGDKGFTSLPNVTFQIANNVTNPADVWLDYMTSERYGAGIDVNTIDETARLAWYDFCEEDISYTSVNLDPQGGAGTTNQLTSRYSINGVIDTSNQVKTNIDTILQNGGAWMSYNVDTGLWSPIIKKAVSAGIEGDTATYFTASKGGTTLTVSAFPSGRIEVGQQLYNSSNTLIGTITAQLFPLTAGETTGQIGRYTVSGASSTITTTTFYTLPASVLEFSDDNIISGISISSTRLEDLYNQVEVEFYNKYNKDQKAYFRNNLDQEDRNPNEPDNQLRMSLDLCNNSPQADMLGQMELRQSRDDLVIEFTSTHYGIQAQGGDVIAVTSELYGWYPKYFRVMRVKEIEGDDGSLVANIQALEYNPDAYTVESITEFSTAGNIGIGVYGSSPNLPLPPSLVIASVDADAPIPNFELQVTVPASGGPFDEIELYYTEGWDEHGINGKIVEGQVAVTAATGNGSTATLTFATQTFTPYDIGQVVTIAGMTPSGYNGVKTITGATASTISYASTTTGAMTVAGTITNAAGAGLGLLTVTATTYGNINPGDRIDLPSDIFIVSQLTNNPVSKTFSSGGVPASSTSTLITLNNVTGLIVGNTLTGPGILNGSFITEIDSGTNTVRIEDAVTVQAGSFTSTGSTISGTTLTIGTLSTGSIVIGQTLTGTGVTSGTTIIAQISTGSGSGSTWTVSASQTVTSTAITGTSIYAVTGGLGTYIVDTSVMASNVGGVAVNLFDFPETDNYKPLKKIVPSGNDPTFTNNQVVRDVVTNVPANSATYRRWFVKARMGIRKQFGVFSEPGDTDFDTGRFPYDPNPVAAGALSDLTDVSITSANEGQTLYYDATISKWKNNSILEVDDATTFGGIVVGEGITQPMITFTTQPDGVNAMYGIRGKSSIDDAWFVGSGSTANDEGYLELATADNIGGSNDGGQIYVRQYDGASPKTGAPWYGGNGTVVNELTLLDNIGNTSIPNNTTIGLDLTVNGGNINLNGQATAGVQPFITFATQTVDDDNPMYGIRGMSTIDDPWFVGAGSVGNDGGYLEIATGDNAGGTNSGGQIYVRQYSGESSGGAPWYGGSGTAQRTLTLLDNVGYTSIPLRLGINDTTPSYTLDVNGDARITLDAVISGDLTVNGTTSAGLVADIGTSNVNGAIFNTVTTTLDIGGAASTFNLGANSGTMTIGNPTVRGTQTTQNLYNTVATTLNIGGASTATNIGAGTGTTTIGNDLAVKGTNLILNSDAASGSQDVTILIERGSSGDTYIKYNETTDRFEFASPTTTLNGLGARFSQDLFGSGLHGAVIAGTTGDMGLGGDFYFQRNGGTYPSSNASIYVDRAATATDSYITWDEANVRWNISNDTNVVGNLILTANTIKSNAGTTAITLSGANVVVAGTLELDGNQIKNNAGNTVVTMTGLNTTLAGTLEIDGNEIKSNTGTTAITLSADDVTIAGDLILNGNTIKANGGTTAITINGDDVRIADSLILGGDRILSSGGSTVAITLSGNDVIIADQLTVTGNTIKSNSATAITLSGANVTVAGDLTVTNNTIKSNTATAITLSGDDVTVVGDLTITNNTIKSSTATAITLSGDDITVPGTITSSVNIGSSFFNKVGCALDAVADTEVVMDNLKIRLHTTSGANMRVEARAVSSTFAGQVTMINNVNGTAINGEDTYQSYPTTVWTSIGSSSNLSAFGDMITFHMYDNSVLALYRVTTIRGPSSSNTGHISIERLI